MKTNGQRLFVMILGILIYAVIIAGCGGPEEPVTVTRISEAGLDGRITKFIDDSLSVLSDDDTLEIGDFGSTKARSFVSFLLDLPSGTVINSAVLRVCYGYLADPSHNPFTTIGPVYVDHLAYGDTLTGSAFGQTALSELGAFAGSEPAGDTFVELDVTTCVKADIDASRTRSQFRLRHYGDTDGDDKTDLSLWYSGDAPDAAKRPQLVITYTPD